MKFNFRNFEFPYSQIREGQDEFLTQVHKTIQESSNIYVSAPTGLGKTISALLPALDVAKEKNLSVIFLTSRQTQANQAISTIKDIVEITGKNIRSTAFIGKRSMCVHPDRDQYSPQDFNDFCRKVRENGTCKFYSNVRDSENSDELQGVLQRSSESFFTVEGFVKLSGDNKLCPYEVASQLTYKADVIVCDYNYLFSEGIRERFLGRIGRTLEECILVVDEAHNLPSRIMNSLSYSLSSSIIKNAIKECREIIKDETIDDYLQKLDNIIGDIWKEIGNSDLEEISINKEDFFKYFYEKFGDEVKYSKVEDDLEDFAFKVKEHRVVSFVGKIASFMRKWRELEEENYLRSIDISLSEKSEIINLRIRCIDPAVTASETLNGAYSSVLMSATLSPIQMYKDILGTPEARDLSLESPFSKQNQLTLTVDDVSTKYSMRNQGMFKRIGQHLTSLLKDVNDRNAIIFFPSYSIMEKVLNHIRLTDLNRKVLIEQRNMSKKQKEEYVSMFKEGSGNPFLTPSKSRVLFAVTSGSFAEGLDLPKESLEMVVVVGVPLAVPDVFTQALITHYDKKFGKGQFYGYIYPAINKIVQAAGRCIRSETDRGAVILMDMRFSSPTYAQGLPTHWKIKRTYNLSEDVKRFFIQSD